MNDLPRQLLPAVIVYKYIYKEQIVRNENNIKLRTCLEENPPEIVRPNAPMVRIACCDEETSALSDLAIYICMYYHA